MNTFCAVAWEICLLWAITIFYMRNVVTGLHLLHCSQHLWPTDGSWSSGWTLESSASIRTLAAVGGPLGARGHHGARGAARADGSGRCLRRVHVRLLLGLHDVFLVADPLVTEPVAHLQVNVKYCLSNKNIFSVREKNILSRREKIFCL